MAFVWSDNVKHVFQITDEPYVRESYQEPLAIGWYFHDEIYDEHGPFNSEERAAFELSRYAKYLEAGITPQYTPEQIAQYNITAEEVAQDEKYRAKQWAHMEQVNAYARDAAEDAKINALEEALFDSDTGAPS